MFFIKRFKNYLFNPLRHIINRSLETGYVPQQFKIAKVNPLFKAGDRSLPDNYRPFSLLSCFQKYWKKLLGGGLSPSLNQMVLFPLLSLVFVKITLPP